MSQSSRESLGSRENFFDVEHGGYQGVEPPQQVGHVEKPGITWESYVAGSILRQNPDADLYCPVCLYELPDDEQRQVELSDPEDFIEPSTVEREDDHGNQWLERRYEDHRRHRHCPECNHVVWGGVLSNVSCESFLAVVDEVLAAIGELPPSRRDRLRTEAEKRKRHGVSDQSNVETMLVELQHGVDS